MPLTEERLRAYAQEALRRPEDFGYNGELPLFQTWGLAPFTTHRDADDLQHSNFECIERDLVAAFPGDVNVERFRHFAVGWIDHLLVKVVDEQGGITPAFRRVMEIQARLLQQPVYDQEDYQSRLDYEEEEEEEEEVVAPAQEYWCDIFDDLFYQRSSPPMMLAEEDHRETLADDIMRLLDDSGGSAVPRHLVVYVLSDPRFRSFRTDNTQQRRAVADALEKEIAPYVGG